MNFLYFLEILEHHRFLMFSEDAKGNIDPEWVKQQQYRQEYQQQFDVVSLL